MVTAMRDGVEIMFLGYVTLNIEELTQYDGLGRCSWLLVYGIW